MTESPGNDFNLSMFLEASSMGLTLPRAVEQDPSFVEAAAAEYRRENTLGSVAMFEALAPVGNENVVRFEKTDSGIYRVARSSEDEAYWQLSRHGHWLRADDSTVARVNFFTGLERSGKLEGEARGMGVYKDDEMALNIGRAEYLRFLVGMAGLRVLGLPDNLTHLPRFDRALDLKPPVRHK